MSQWNLSVRLSGQGSDLSRTLRDTSRDARAASRDVSALRRDITLLRQQARNDIRIRVRVDGQHLREEVRTALAGAGAGQGLAVNLRIADAMQLRRDVANAVRWAAWGHRIEIPIVVRDPNGLRRSVSAAVRRAQQNQTIRIRVTTDTGDLNQIRRTLGGNNRTGGGGDKSGASLKGFLTLAPAAIPLAAGLSAKLAPLAAQFTAAGVAGAAFGIAIAGQIGPLSDVADAEEKYRKAVIQHGAASQQALEASAAYQQQLAQLPPASQQAAIALSTLKGNFSDWSNDMTRFTMKPVTNGIAVLDSLIPRLTPEVKSASTELNRLVTVAGGAISTPGFDTLADKLARFTDGKLNQLTNEVIHLMRVISSGGAGHGVIAAFVDYARANGPAAREAIQAIAKAVIVLMEGAAQAGPSLLTLVTAAAKLVAALPPELVGIILHVAAALKLLQLSGAGMAALAGGLTRVRTQITALTAASAGASGGLAGLRAAFMSLGVAARASIIVAGIAAVVLVLKGLSDIGKKTPPDVDKLTTSLGNLGRTGKTAGEAARAFGKDFSGLADSLRTLARPSNLDKTQQFLTKLVGMDSTPVADAKKDLDAVDKSLASLVQGGKADIAAAAFDQIAAAMRKQGMSGKELKSQLDNYKSALADQKFEAELAAQSMGLFGKAAQDTQAKLDAQKQSADGLRQSIQALNDVQRAGLGGMIGFEAAIDAAAQAARDNAGALDMTGGKLNLNSEKARNAATALQDLASKTDEAAASARESNASWETVNGIYQRGRTELIKNAQAMGLSKTQAAQLADQILKIPDKAARVSMETEDATRDLNAFNNKVRSSPGSKSVTLKTLSSAAEQVLRAFGYKVTHLPNGSVKISASAGQALGAIGNVTGAISRLHDKHITLTTEHRTIYTGKGGRGPNAQADGSVLDFYADGGIRSTQRGGVRSFARGAENHVAQFAPAGSWRMWAEPETGGEAYIPLAPAKRIRSRAIAEETVRRLGGDPEAIQWNADGNVTDWRYDPETGSLYSASDAGAAGHKTKKVKVKVKGKWKTKEVEYFDIGAVEKKLKSAAKATTAWNKDLEKVADRVGGDVAQALASMGEEGMKLAHKMATGSTKYINDMAKALRDLQKTAKASLTDYTRQLGHANTLNKKFSDDLAKLAGMGYGDLASQLAAQNDEAAQQLAAAAVKDPKKAAKANAQAKTANSALTADQVGELVQIIAAIKTKSTGIHAVAGTTGLGEDEIIDVGNKAKGQINKALGTRATRFLQDLAKANKHLAYADGGIRAGIYATQGGIVRFAEPETHGEAYLPLGPNKRRSALPVLADVARRFGVGLTDVSASRPIVIVRGEGDTHVNVTAVRSGATASDIGAQVGRSVRRARRGGVAARAA